MQQPLLVGSQESGVGSLRKGSAWLDGSFRLYRTRLEIDLGYHFVQGSVKYFV